MSAPASVDLRLGLDLTEIERVAGVLERHGPRFLARVFRPGELRLREGSRAFAEHVAGRFAAKEAAMKALGTGLRGVPFRDVEIGADPSGKPRVTFHGRALVRARSLKVISSEVSITHGRDIAAAVVGLLISTVPSPQHH